MLNRLHAREFFLLLLPLITGCVTPSVTGTQTDNETRQIAHVAARDLVYALSQAFLPKITTLQLGPTTTPFSQELAAEIAGTGFGVQRVSADQGTHHLKYSQMNSGLTENTSRTRFLVYIGKTGFERDYMRTSAGYVAPASPLRSFGVSANIKAYPQLFELTSSGESIRPVPASNTKGNRTGIEGNVRAVKNRVRISDKHFDLIATDIVSTMVQLQELSPYTTTLQVSKPPSRFGNAVIRALGYAGYALQQVDSDQGVHYVSYGSRITEDENGQFTDFFLHIGPITLRRAYEQHARHILPASKMTVSGSHSTQNVTLNDAIFLQQGSDRAFPNSLELIAPDGVSVISRKTDKLKLHPLREYTPIYQSEIVFADSSVYMGLDNKGAASVLFQRFRPETDIFTLTSCTESGKNSSSSLQQRARVKEEFLFLGAPIDSVIFDNCPEDSAANDGARFILATEFQLGRVIITQHRTRDRGYKFVQ